MKKWIKMLKQGMQDRVASAVNELKAAKDSFKNAAYEKAAAILEVASVSGVVAADPYLQYNGNRTTLYFNVVCKDGLRTKGLTSLIAYISEMVGEAESSDHVSSWSASRSFSFGRWDSDFRVHMHCEIPAEAKGCRKVAVGEKVETVTQYRIECDDDDKI